MSKNASPRKTLLVVEDDSAFYESIKLALRKQGWKCEWYAYAPSSVGEIRRLGVDAALIDVNLPAGNGIDLINRLRADHIAFPVIVMTGDINAAEQVRASGMENVHLLMKPFELQELRDLLS